MNVLADFAAYDVRAEFSAAARLLMKERRISVPALAARVGLSRRQVDRILSGVSGPGLGHMAAIARELGAELKVKLEVHKKGASTDATLEARDPSGPRVSVARGI